MQELSSSLVSHAFGEHTDPGLIVAYQSHQDAMRFLAATLDQANGVAVLKGPAGSGKTTIINEQQTWSSRDSAVALLDGIHLTPRRLLVSMLSQYGVPESSQYDDQLLQDLNKFLKQQMRSGRAPVLMIDNADRATPSALRLLNWLAALDTRGDYSLRMVLTGKERLLTLLRDDSMRGLARRHPATYSLNPLTRKNARVVWRLAGLDKQTGDRSHGAYDRAAFSEADTARHH